MTTISGSRPVSVPTTTSTRSASQPVAQQSQAATGYGTTDSFQPSTYTPPKALTDAKAQLDKFDGGADRDAVALALNKPWPSAKELKAANDALNKLAANPPEGMTEDDFKKIVNGLGFKQNQATMMSMVTGNMEKQLEEARKRGEKKD